MIVTIDLRNQDIFRQGTKFLFAMAQFLVTFSRPLALAKESVIALWGRLFGWTHLLGIFIKNWHAGVLLTQI